MVWIILVAFIAALAYAIIMQHERDEWRSRAEIAEAVNIANRQAGNAKDTANTWGKFMLSDMIDDLRKRQLDAVRLMEQGDYYEARKVLEGKNDG